MTQVNPRTALSVRARKSEQAEFSKRDVGRAEKRVRVAGMRVWLCKTRAHKTLETLHVRMEKAPGEVAQSVDVPRVWSWAQGCETGPQCTQDKVFSHWQRASGPISGRGSWPAIEEVQS